MTDFTDAGSLYVVSTPIGNLEDMSHRAIRILGSVERIAAEDTRHTGNLLRHFDVQNSLESYHDHNKEKKTPALVNKLLSGISLAVVSDAGTPGISDPAFYLVRAAIAAGVTVIPIPGPTAAITALVASGLPTDRFVFEGFLPVKKGRRTRLELLKDESRTVVLYESPHRLIRTLKDVLEYFGDRQIAVCRELTKKFEEFVRGSVSEVLSVFENRKILGEFVLVIHGQEKRKHG